MEGTRCPICQAFSVVDGISEGDMVSCAYCKKKYTLIQSRLYSIIPKGTRLGLKESMDCREIEGYVKELENDYLMQVLKIITEELIARYRKR